ncbi:MAG: pantoate--beta-alanine ligase [Candidatus Omnitrophica bacterium]|nr:pantoate--beta-alanine ligase [Candidatus Omnitrophota bacterium]
MRLLRLARQMAQAARALQRDGRTIGFVPTMGALHDGHLSLVRAAKRQADIAVASLFVNPLQFGPHEDYARYPRNLRRDLALLRAAGCDVVFAPSASQIYPPSFSTSVEVSGLTDRFEGAIRPGHFRGVASVVAKLFGLVRPSVAYFGQKDYQQVLVVQRMAEDLDLGVVIRMGPTIREPDGLAMSSRNAYLSPRHRRRAPTLYAALRQAVAAIRAGERDPAAIAALGRRLLVEEAGLRIDYFSAVSAKDLAQLRRLRGRVVILGAIRLGRTRLIDNILVDVP